MLGGFTPAAHAAPHRVHPAQVQDLCSSGTAVPCIVALSRDGVDETGSDEYDARVVDSSGEGAHSVMWEVDSQAAAVHDPITNENYLSLQPDEVSHNWSITFRVGFTPREADAGAANLSVSTTDNGDGTYNVTFRGNPVETGPNDECNTSVWPWKCPSTSGAVVVNFDGQSSDFEQWTDQSQWQDFKGMDIGSNIEQLGLPPSIDSGSFTMTIDAANSHVLAGASSPFQGFFDIRIPNAYLEDMGIDDPSTLTPTGLSASAGGAGTAVVTPYATATEVDITGMTFSPHVVKVKTGVITPTAPSKLKAHRNATTRATLTFTRAKPRGSRITSYQARCTAKHHTTVRAKGKHVRIHLHGLSAGTAYRCQARARAKAGYGHWSAKEELRP